MKTLCLSLLAAFLLICSSCIPEDPGPQMKREAEAKVRGAWEVEKIIDQVYDPIPTLHSTTEYVGVDGDLYTFNSNGVVSINTQQTGAREENYGVINPYQIIIGNDSWRMDTLTATQLLLVKDLNKVTENKRYVTKIYLRR